MRERKERGGLVSEKDSNFLQKKEKDYKNKILTKK